MKKLLYLLFCLTSQIAFSQSYHFDILKDINDRTADTYIYGIEKVSNNVVIVQSAIDSVNQTSFIRFWKTNGSDIENYSNIGADNAIYAGLKNFSVHNNKLYFTIDNSSNGLWVSDLQNNQTKKISPLSYYNTGYFDYTIFNNQVYFVSDTYANGSHTEKGNELMYYDEIQNSTGIVKDINPNGDADPNHFTVVGSKLYFSADDVNDFFGPFNRELWVTNGTINGTYKVKEINPTSNGSFPENLARVGNKIIFKANDGNDYYLYTSDGTNQGTTILKSLKSFTTDSYYAVRVMDIYSFGEQALILIDVGNYKQIWITDGTPENTKFVYNYSSIGIFSKKEIAIKDGFVFFMYNSRLYKTNGSTVVMLKENIINPYIISNFKMALKSDYNICFSFGKNFYQSDGTPSGTYLINENFENITYTSPISFETINNKILAYCTPFYNKFGKEIYEIKQDTIKIFKDFNPVTIPSEHSFMFNNSGKSYFWAKYPQGLFQLFETDGTTEGTKGIQLNNTYSKSNFVIINHTVFFIYGNSIQKMDFNTGNTILIKYLPQPILVPYNYKFVSSINKFYFITYGNTYNENQLWESDGTEYGTKLLKTFEGIQNFNLAVNNNHLYVFVKNTNAIEVWHLGENESQLLKIKSFITNPYDHFGEFYPNFKNKALFLIRVANQNQLWESDGTIDGTKVNEELFPEIHEFGDLFITNDYYYYSIFTPNIGTKIWKSNGIETSLLIDIPDAESKVHAYALCKNNLFFVLKRNTGLDKDYLYKYDLSNENIEVLSVLESFNKEYNKNFICLQDKLVFSAKSNSYDSGRSQVHISDGTQAGTRFIASMENKTVGFNSHASRGIFPLNDKEILVSVDDKFYGLEWFTFRICDNPSDLSGSTSDSKIQSSPSTINSTERLTGDSRVYYFAPQSINLNPGFSTDNSGIFKAEIKERGCTFRN